METMETIQKQAWQMHSLDIKEIMTQYMDENDSSNSLISDLYFDEVLKLLVFKLKNQKVNLKN
jgi:hypothetical protein